MARGIGNSGERLGHVHASEAGQSVPGGGTLDWAGLAL